MTNDSQISLKIASPEFKEFLRNNILKIIRNRKVVLKRFGIYLVSSTKLRFSQGVDPEGNTWPRSVRSIVQGGQTLLDKGLLRNSVQYAVTDTDVTWGSNLKYAAIHQHGGIIKAKQKPYLQFMISDGFNTNWVKVKQVKIPQRSYLGISEQDETELLEIGLDWLEEG